LKKIVNERIGGSGGIEKVGRSQSSRQMSNTSPSKPIITVIFLYAITLLGFGLYAFLAAPADANKTTALAIPGGAAGVIAVVGLVTFALRKGRKWIFAAGLAAVLAAVFTFVFMAPARARGKALERVPAIQAEYEAAVRTGTAEQTAGARREFFREPLSVVKQFEAAVAAGSVENTPLARKSFIFARNAPSGDIGYLIFTLWSLTALSAVFAVVLAVMTWRAWGLLPIRRNAASGAP
jgi:hypothetical protein